MSRKRPSSARSRSRSVESTEPDIWCISRERRGPGLRGRHKSKAIVLGNLALAHVRQRDVEQAATVLHRAIDLLEVSRGGGGLNVVSAAVRELHPWRNQPDVQDMNERLLALMTLN